MEKLTPQPMPTGWPPSTRLTPAATVRPAAGAAEAGRVVAGWTEGAKQEKRELDLRVRSEPDLPAGACTGRRHAVISAPNTAVPIHKGWRSGAGLTPAASCV